MQDMKIKKIKKSNLVEEICMTGVTFGSITGGDNCIIW